MTQRFWLRDVRHIQDVQAVGGTDERITELHLHRGGPRNRGFVDHGGHVRMERVVEAEHDQARGA